MLREEETILIRQVIDYSEIILPVEARNRYELLDIEKNQKFYAYELPGNFWWSWLIRALLVYLRPFTLRIIDKENNVLVEIERSFRWYFHRVNVYGPGRSYLGTVERRFSIVHKLFYVFNSENEFLCELKGPFWRPWTFNIVQGGKTYGSIKKSWSGALKEVFTDADLFGVQFPDGANETEKRLLLAAVFLIDFVYFEGNPGKNYMPDVGV